MKLLRTIGAAAVAGLAALTVPGADPAYAAAPTVTISAPGEGATLGAPAGAGGTAFMQNTSATLTRASVTFASLDGHTSENATFNFERGGSNNSPVFSSSANNSVQFGFTVSPRHNGAYTITANASGRDPAPDINGEETSPNTVRRVNVEFPPAKPSLVAAEIDANTKKVTVTWPANNEPDLVGYQVQRAFNNGSYREIGLAAAIAKPTFSDDLSDGSKYPPGQYRYRVVAVRRARTCANPGSDPACNRGITSSPSEYDSVTVRAASAPPASTTTTTRNTSTTRRGANDDDGGSSGRTGSGSGSGSGTSSSGAGSGGSGSNVDLSAYRSLLNGKEFTTRTPDQIDEGTYDPNLVYGERPPQDEESEDEGVIEIGGKTIGPLKTSDDWVKFLGAGSLATALLVHVLWFKGQVDNIPLEAVTPQGD